MSCCKARRKRLEHERSVGECFSLLLELNSLRIAILNFENNFIFKRTIQSLSLSTLKLANRNVFQNMLEWAKLSDRLNKTKAVNTVKASKLSHLKTSETLGEFKCRGNVLFTSKSQFLKVKSAFKSGQFFGHKLNPKVKILQNSPTSSQKRCFSRAIELML